MSLIPALRPPRLAPAALALAAAFAPGLCAAYETELGHGLQLRVSGTLTAGTSLRPNDPSASVYGPLSAARVGLPPGALGGNSGGSNLNFEKGHAISAVAKGLLDADLRYDNLGVFARLMAWYDYALSENDRPYGNYPNQFKRNVPLSDDGFEKAARFSGAMLTDAYAYGRFKVAEDMDLSVRAGRQTVGWGVAQFTPGGINVVNPLNLAAQVRPGALPDEGRVAVGMVYANLAAGKQWGVDGFYQYEYVGNVLSGCGTYFALPNYAPPGCDFVNVLGGSGVTDPVALATGLYPKRLADKDASDTGQWGLSGRYRLEALKTEFRAYAMNYHARGSFISVTNPNVNGGYGTFNPNNLTNPAANTRLTSPTGLKYQMVNPEDIQLYGASFDAAPAPGLRVYGEVAYRPNQPLQINASDLISAFLTRAPRSALNLSKGVLALAPGASFEGWDRYAVTTATVGATQILPDLAWATRVVFGAEIGISRVVGLPNPGQLRYGRSDDYGQAQVTGGPPCVDNTWAQKSCPVDGFVTSMAWGYRLRAAATYPNALFGATVTPILLFGQDVSGYSFGNYYLEGRWLFRPAVRADWGSYFAEVQYWATGGGVYNTFVDRRQLLLWAGYRF
jgi:hypothetical protein